MAGLAEFKRPQPSSTGRTKPGGRGKREPIDTGTPELGKRHKLRVERGVGVVRIRNMDGTPLDKLLFQELITPEEYSALDDFYADAFRAGLSPLKARPMWKVIGGSVQGEQDQSADQANLCAMLRKLCLLVGRMSGVAAQQELMGGIFQSECHTAAGTELLRRAANSLLSSQALEIRRLHRR